MPNPIQANTVQSTQINHALTQPLFADHIRAWADAPVAGAGENRDAAYQKIMHAYTHSTPDLDLSGLNLTSLPRQLGELLSLTTLNLSRNQLTQLPGEIAQLTNLLALEISRNVLTSLGVIEQLGNLRELDITHNIDLSPDTRNTTDHILSILPSLTMLNGYVLPGTAINPPSDFHHEIEHSALSEVIHQCYIQAKQPYSDELKAKWNAIVTDAQKQDETCIQVNSFLQFIEKISLECIPKYFAAEEVITLLEVAIKDHALRTELFQLAQEGIANCKDNRVITFNNMQLSAKCLELLENNTDKDKTAALISLLKGQYRQHMLAGFTEKFMIERWRALGHAISADGTPLDKDGNKTAQHLNEAIEIELALRHLLADRLKLPFPIKEMQNLKYAQMLMVGNVDQHGKPTTPDRKPLDKILEEASEFAYQQSENLPDVAMFMLERQPWTKYLTQHFADDLNQIEESFMSRQKELEKSFEISAEVAALGITETVAYSAEIFSTDFRNLNAQKEEAVYAFLLPKTEALLQTDSNKTLNESLLMA